MNSLRAGLSRLAADMMKAPEPVIDLLEDQAKADEAAMAAREDAVFLAGQKLKAGGYMAFEDDRFPGMVIRNYGGGTFNVFQDGEEVDAFTQYNSPGGETRHTMETAGAAAQEHFDQMENPDAVEASKKKVKAAEELSDRAKDLQERAKGKIGACSECDALGWRLYPSGDGDVWDTCLTCNEDGKIPFPEMRSKVTAAPEDKEKKPKEEPKAGAPKKKEEPKKAAKPKKDANTIYCPACGSDGPWTILDMHLYVHNVPAPKLHADGMHEYDDTKGESEGWDYVTDGQVQCNKCKKENDINELMKMVEKAAAPTAPMPEDVKFLKKDE